MAQCPRQSWLHPGRCPGHLVSWLPPRASPASRSLTKAALAAPPAVLSYSREVSPHSKNRHRLPQSRQQVALMGVQAARASASEIPARVFGRFQPRRPPAQELPDGFKPFTSLLKGKPAHSLPRPWTCLPPAEPLLSTQRPSLGNQAPPPLSCGSSTWNAAPLLHRRLAQQASWALELSFPRSETPAARGRPEGRAMWNFCF